MPIQSEKPLHGTRPHSDELPVTGPGTNLYRLSPERTGKNHGSALQPQATPVQQYPPRSAGKPSGMGYIPKILISGRYFPEVKTHGGASLTKGSHSEDKTARRSPEGTAKKTPELIRQTDHPAGADERKGEKKNRPATLIIPEDQPDEAEQRGKTGRAFWSGIITIGWSMYRSGCILW